MDANRAATIGKLGAAVTIAYASTYYLPAIVAPAMARSLGVSAPTVFLAFSAALLLSLPGPLGGSPGRPPRRRAVMSTASLVFAAGLAALAFAQGPATLFLAWLLIGVGMSAGFYETAFSTLVGVYGTGARPAITGITLIAGFASTVGWPLTAWLEASFGWRGACLAWAGIHLAVALPLNLWLPRARLAEVQDARREITETQGPASARTAWLLAFVFGVTWFVSTAMAAHLPRLLQAGGVPPAAAIALAALVGPAQVAGRLLEYGLLRNVSPLASARAASLAHAIGAVAFLALGVPAGVVFTVLHGASNGVMTITNGTLPLHFFGPQGYGARQGRLMMPARFAQALAPYLFGLALDGFGASALWASIGLGLASCAALFALGARRAK